MNACKTNRATKNLTFEITTSQDYCGGAHPTDELVEDMLKPKPYTGTIYIHQSSVREDEGIQLQIEEGKANSSGLSTGTYYLYLTPKLNDPVTETNVSPKEQKRTECNLMHNKKSLSSFTIEEKSTNVSRNLHIICDPCMDPLP
ncbi:MAG: hypothetical protein HKP14_11160 [Bacteroidia bacterium]|nr:hypothetical protein [Bacteroidia bacterium]